MEKDTGYVLKLNGQFFVHSGKVSDEFPEARVFPDYSAAYDAIERYNLTDKGHVEVYYNYGLDDETVEDA